MKGKKRLSIELVGKEEQLAKEFKGKCYRLGLSMRKIIVSYMEKFMKEGA